MDEVPRSARRLWRHLAGDERALRPGSRTVVRGSRGLCPVGWTGVLRLGDAVVVEAGAAAGDVLDVLLDLGDPTDRDAVLAALAVEDVLGPGVLHHLPDADRVPPPAATEVVEVGAGALRPWLETVPGADVAESSVGDLDRAWVVEVDGRPAGACGWVPWPCAVAHLGVLVDPAHRGRGVGTVVAAAATRAALAAGRHPQWRAATDNPASLRIAHAIGFVAIGRQLGLRSPRLRSPRPRHRSGP